MTTAPDADAIASQLAAVTDYVRQCQARIVRGEVMDLGGLDRTVAAICADIAQLPPQDARAQEPQMQKLVEGLDGLAVAMKEQKERMSGGGGR